MRGGKGEARARTSFLLRCACHGCGLCHDLHPGLCREPPCVRCRLCGEDETETGGKRKGTNGVSVWHLKREEDPRTRGRRDRQLGAGRHVGSICPHVRRGRPWHALGGQRAAGGEQRGEEGTGIGSVRCPLRRGGVRGTCAGGERRTVEEGKRVASGHRHGGGRGTTCDCVPHIYPGSDSATLYSSCHKTTRPSDTAPHTGLSCSLPSSACSRPLQPAKASRRRPPPLGTGWSRTLRPLDG